MKAAFLSLLLLLSGPALSAAGATRPGSVALEVSFPAVPGLRNACGIAALSAAAGYWGVTARPAEISARLAEPGEPTTVLELLLLARQYGLWSHAFRADLEEALEYLSRGVPLVVLLELGAGPFRAPHFVILSGYDARRGVVSFHSTWKRDSFLSERAFRRAWRRRGRIALLVIPPDAALEARLLPEHAGLLGIHLHGRGRPGEAVPFFRQVLESADHPGHRFNLAAALAASGEEGPARVIYRRLVEVDGYPPAFNNLALLILGEDPAGALELAREGLRRDPAREEWYRGTIRKARQALDLPTGY